MKEEQEGDSTDSPGPVQGRRVKDEQINNNNNNNNNNKNNNKRVKIETKL